MKILESLPTFNAEAVLGSRDLVEFTKYMWPQFNATDFHVTYYRVLDMFAKGAIKNLIVTIPPQHGKSQGSSRYLPAFMLGRNPDISIALMSYSTTFARKFNRHLQRTIDTPEYREVFPDTTINSDNVVTVARGYLRNADEFEIVGRIGSFKAIGREGSLTGNPVDIMIFDDLYKDAMEGNSPVVRDNVVEMYKAVAETRYHNDSQQLCVFTRWHEEDLIGWFEKHHKVYTINSFDDISLIDNWQNTWVKINYEAIKESDPTEIDPRQIGEPLFAERHSRAKLEGARSSDGGVFQCMYQGDPTPKEGLLYGPFNTYDTMPVTVKKANYTDTADTGTDYTCSICYEVGNNGFIYVTDVLYTLESMEITERQMPLMLQRTGTKDARIESNNGGRGFARVVQDKCPDVSVTWFHQSQNKESRITTNSSQVNSKILMPIGWEGRWPDFSSHLKTFKRIFRANKNDDAPDALTGVYESATKSRFTNADKMAGIFF